MLCLYQLKKNVINYPVNINIPVEVTSGTGNVVSTPSSSPIGYIERLNAPKASTDIAIHTSLSVKRDKTINAQAQIAQAHMHAFIVSSNKRVRSTKIPKIAENISPTTIIPPPIIPEKELEYPRIF